MAAIRESNEAGRTAPTIGRVANGCERHSKAARCDAQARFVAVADARLHRGCRNRAAFRGQAPSRRMLAFAVHDPEGTRPDGFDVWALSHCCHLASQATRGCKASPSRKGGIFEASPSRPQTCPACL